MSDVTSLATTGGGLAALGAPDASRALPKKATGIAGFDEVSQGGLPAERLTLISGGPGTGKTLFGIQTLFNRLQLHGEPGILVSFEEPVARIRQNLASFSWGAAAAGHHQLVMLEARLPNDIVHAGAFDLTGLLAALSQHKAESGASNVVFDSIDVLLGALHNETLERQELSRINDWVSAEGMTAVITVGEFGAHEPDQRRADYLSYLTDCVVKLGAALFETNLSRTVRIAKYRGSGFTGNLFPLVFTSNAVEVVATGNSRLSYPTFDERVSSGVPRLDGLLSGGFVRGTSILVSGSPGTAKTSLAASFIAAAAARGETAVFVSFDESDTQIVANMRSIGVDLQSHIDAGRLIMASLRSGNRSPEEHFLTIRGLLARHRPGCLVIDPLSALLKAHYPFTVLIAESLLDYARANGITTVCTSLLEQHAADGELSASHVSTIADTWLHVSYVAVGGERNRALTIVKSRGTLHSNQVRELVLSPAGLDIIDVYAAEGAVLMGSARAEKEHQLRQTELLNDLKYREQRFSLDRSISDLESRAQMAARDLEWARREADLVREAETLRRAERDRAAADRVQVRSRADHVDGSASDANAGDANAGDGQAGGR